MSVDIKGKSKLLANMENNLSRMYEFVEIINNYLTSKKLEIILMDCDIEKRDNFIKILKRNNEGRENIIITSSDNIIGNIYLRWYKYDVEFVFDDRASGKMGTTGKSENIMIVMALLDCKKSEKKSSSSKICKN